MPGADTPEEGRQMSGHLRIVSPSSSLLRAHGHQSVWIVIVPTGTRELIISCTQGFTLCLDCQSDLIRSDEATRLNLNLVHRPSRGFTRGLGSGSSTGGEYRFYGPPPKKTTGPKCLLIGEASFWLQFSITVLNFKIKSTTI